MMDVREKLVELFYDNNVWCDQKIEGLADDVMHIISNSVTVQDGNDNDFPTKWISVNDRLPEEKVDCIVHYKHAYCDNDGYWAIGMCFYDGEKFQFNPAYKVTHWMPIPKPPKGE